VTLGDLCTGAPISAPALAVALAMSQAGLAALEATPIHRMGNGGRAFASYLPGLGARAEIVFADGGRLEVPS
jgi:hypothetical protein